MRIKLLLSPTNNMLPIQNQHIVNSFIHKALGPNNKYHNEKNDYSISSLQGGKLINGTTNISFQNGGYITISSLNNQFIDELLIGAYTTPFYEDISVIGNDFIDEKFNDGWNHFATLSPFLIKQYKNKLEYNFLTLDTPNFQEEVKLYLINEISKINPNLDLTNFDVRIADHPSHKIKKIMVKNVVNRANQCQISIHTNKKVAKLLYNIGLGQSTGSGFGTIYKTENHKLYR